MRDTQASACRWCDVIRRDHDSNWHGLPVGRHDWTDPNPKRHRTSRTDPEIRWETTDV